jgi:hypothetical protein
MSILMNRILDVVASYAIVVLGLAIAGATAAVGAYARCDAHKPRLPEDPQARPSAQFASGKTWPGRHGEVAESALWSSSQRPL